MCEGKAGLLHHGILAIQPGRRLCLESNQTNVNTAKPYHCGSETMVTTSQDTPLPPSPIPGGCGERRIWGSAAGGGFASLQAPKGEGAHPGSCRMGETCAIHGVGTRCWESPTLLLLQAAQSSSATALVQTRQLRAQTIQHRPISAPQTSPGRSLMPTGQSPGAHGSITISVECQLPLGQIFLRRSKLARLLWDDIILTTLQGLER